MGERKQVGAGRGKESSLAGGRVQAGSTGVAVSLFQPAEEGSCSSLGRDTVGGRSVCLAGGVGKEVGPPGIPTRQEM